MQQLVKCFNFSWVHVVVAVDMQSFANTVNLGCHEIVTASYQSEALCGAATNVGQGT
jgi:ABC-type arginine transport system permease subunit